ncbi:MAG: SHOCT domain-containing protein [Campylobacterota bacterium]
MFGYMDMNMTLFHGFSMFIFWLVFFFIIVSIFTKKESTKNESALDILKKRLAKGEISKEEYDELKKTIN